MYKVIASKIESEGKTEIVYGLKHDDGTVMEDVSPDKATVERLAEYYTKMGVSPWNLEEVVKDMIDTVCGLDIVNTL